MSGEICLSCKKKLQMIPNYQYLTAQQINDVINGNATPQEVSTVMTPMASYAPNTYVPIQAPSSQGDYVCSSSGLSASPSVQTSQSSGSFVPNASSVIDELKQYKELLDQDIINDEEFAQIKKRLLNL